MWEVRTRPPCGVGSYQQPDNAGEACISNQQTSPVRRQKLAKTFFEGWNGRYGGEAGFKAF
jgi:hypothetical protein